MDFKLIIEKKYLFELIRKYKKLKRSTIFDKPINEDNVNDIIIEHFQKYSSWIKEKGIITSKKDIKKEDMIDFSKCIVEGVGEGNDLPKIKYSEEYFSRICENWFVIIPPFEEGVLKINKKRYLEFKVEEVDIDEKNVKILINDYAQVNNMWVLENVVECRIFNDSSEVGFKYDVIKEKHFTDIVEEHLNRPDCDVDSDTVLFLKNVCIPHLKFVSNSDEYAKKIVGHFLIAIVRTNIDILDSRPKVKKPTPNTKGIKVRTEAGEVEKTPPAHVIRTFKSGIVISSDKAPKIGVKEIIRRYTKVSWKTVGHTRRYKSGKIVYIRPSIHHRKCLEGKEGEAAQIIVNVG